MSGRRRVSNDPYPYLRVADRSASRPEIGSLVPPGRCVPPDGLRGLAAAAPAPAREAARSPARVPPAAPAPVPDPSRAVPALRRGGVSGS